MSKPRMIRAFLAMAMKMAHWFYLDWRAAGWRAACDEMTRWMWSAKNAFEDSIEETERWKAKQWKSSPPGTL